ncbi:hypothetical protein JKY72_02465 [Candidatus Gracilibacteria bacterium]|nr:hypothetical protein [Candidatus Gracilibacteria bacterium]
MPLRLSSNSGEVVVPELTARFTKLGDDTEYHSSMRFSEDGLDSRLGSEEFARLVSAIRDGFFTRADAVLDLGAHNVSVV